MRRPAGTPASITHRSSSGTRPRVQRVQVPASHRGRWRLGRRQPPDSEGSFGHPGSNWACWSAGDDILGSNCDLGAVDFGDGLREVLPAPEHDRSRAGAVGSDPHRRVSRRRDRRSDAHTVNKGVNLDLLGGGSGGNHGKVGLHARTYAYVDGPSRRSRTSGTNSPGHPYAAPSERTHHRLQRAALRAPVAGHFPDDGSPSAGRLAEHPLLHTSEGRQPADSHSWRPRPGSRTRHAS